MTAVDAIPHGVPTGAGSFVPESPPSGSQGGKM